MKFEREIVFDRCCIDHKLMRAEDFKIVSFTSKPYSSLSFYKISYFINNNKLY